MRLRGLLRRGRGEVADVAVVGSGLPALAAALELARRRKRVSAVGLAAAGERPVGLGLVVLGPSRPYDRVVRALGDAAARDVWAAGRENLARLREFLEEARRDCGLNARGSFLLASDRKEAEALAESEDRLRDEGFSGEFLDHYMLETRFDVSGFAGAYWAAEGAEVDPTALGGALSEAGRAAGVRFVPAPVRALHADRAGVVIETEDATVRADAALFATDTVAPALVPELAALVRPTAGARLRFEPEEGAMVPAAARTVDGEVAWVASSSGITLAATGPAAAGAHTRLEALAPRLQARPPGRRSWIEPAEAGPHGLPVVGILPGRPLAIACGFSAFAASFALVAARWTADALLTGHDPTPDPLRPPGPAPGPV